MELNDKQQRILEAIQATRPGTEEDAACAVPAGLAAHGEDGDIDLTQEGRRYVDSSSL